ncbi:MAG: hypothetical protein LBT59_15015, partial [Clostridiales bacterium]|nr:hypothetical protein [Clostridiales bacterium]
FAYGFLQIPLAEGTLAVWLVVPTAKPTVDFHHLVDAHARSTRKRYASLRHNGFAGLEKEAGCRPPSFIQLGHPLFPYLA